MTPEGKVKKCIKDTLKNFGAYYHMPVQNGMGKPTLDFIGCCNGRFFAVEAKAAGKKLTERQKITRDEMHAAGAAVFVIDGPDSLTELLDWLTKRS